MTVFLCLPTRPAPCLLPALMTLLGLAVPLFCWIFGPEHLTESSLTSLCLKKVFFLQKDKGEGMLNSYCLIFFLFPSHYHSCSNLSNVSKVWPSLNFLCKKEYVMAGKISSVASSNYSYFYFASFGSIDMTSKKKIQSSRCFSISRCFFLHEQNPSGFLTLHPGISLSHRRCGSSGPKDRQRCCVLLRTVGLC